MTKQGTKLTDEHKANIAKSVKMRWERGDFNSEAIRNKWRETALSGIAKKGRKNPNKYIPSQEMIDDYSKMGDKDLSSKYGVSRRLIGVIRKEYNLPRFNNQFGLRPHEFRDGKEYKWCGSGHWELIENFGVHSSRYDGLRGHCKFHSNQSSYKSNRKILDTPEGKAKLRFRNNRRKTVFTVWEYQDEKRSMQLYGKRCAYCGVPITYKTVQFDHIIPVSKGGTTIPENMLPACMSCNNNKKAKDVVSWLNHKFGNDIGGAIYESICEKQNIIAYETKERIVYYQSLLGE